jgi:uncharacterized membrane protein
LNFILRDINPGCHGIPERCLVIGGRRMAICARCFGSCIGHCVAFFIMLFYFLPPWYISILLIVPLAIDWSLQEFAGLISTNFRRLITGLFGGFGVGALIWGFVLYLFRLIFN